eukprot:scaffold124233_cov18-Tisochrysis_lutea.AAC.2
MPECGGELAQRDGTGLVGVEERKGAAQPLPLRRSEPAAAGGRARRGRGGRGNQLAARGRAVKQRPQLEAQLGKLLERERAVCVGVRLIEKLESRVVRHAMQPGRTQRLVQLALRDGARAVSVGGDEGGEQARVEARRARRLGGRRARERVRRVSRGRAAVRL